MIIRILRNQWIVVEGIEPLLFTASDHKEQAISKFRKSNHDGNRFNIGSNSKYKLANVKIEVTDLNLDD